MVMMINVKICPNTFPHSLTNFSTRSTCLTYIRCKISKPNQPVPFFPHSRSHPYHTSHVGKEGILLSARQRRPCSTIAGYSRGIFSRPRKRTIDAIEKYCNSPRRLRREGKCVELSGVRCDVAKSVVRPSTSDDHG